MNFLNSQSYKLLALYILNSAINTVWCQSNYTSSHTAHSSYLQYTICTIQSVPKFRIRGTCNILR